MGNDDSDYEIIFRPYRRRPDGTIEWAKKYGLKAFPIRIRKGKAENPENLKKGNENKE